MEIDCGDFRVRPGAKVKLKHWPTRVKPYYHSADAYKALLATQADALRSLQKIHYASGQYALLLIVQGMDTAGKDGVIGHVMAGVNPQGCRVESFRQPSAEELEHDFLWREVQRLPARGQVGIFNRSYYEEVLVVRVHPEILQRQGLPKALREEPKVWEHRYRSIVDLERHLHRNATRTVKIFLHLSLEEQRKRLLERIDNPEKNWKLSLDDIRERKFWGRYQEAYEECLRATSTAFAPWYVVPADDKDNARLVVSSLVAEALRGLHSEYPKMGAGQKRELAKMRKALAGKKAE